jgi:hypothetical protein
MTKIILDIKTCRECSNIDVIRGYISPDSFEAPNYDWFCKVNGEKIRGYVEWHEENKIPIPEWCPILLKKTNQKKTNCLPCNNTGKVTYRNEHGLDDIIIDCPICNKNK